MRHGAEGENYYFFDDDGVCVCYKKKSSNTNSNSCAITCETLCFSSTTDVVAKSMSLSRSRELGDFKF